MSAVEPGLKVGNVMYVGLTKATVFQMLPAGKESECEHKFMSTIGRCARRLELTVAMAAERPDSDLCFRAGPVGVTNYNPPHRKVVPEVKVTSIRVPDRK